MSRKRYPEEFKVEVVRQSRAVQAVSSLHTEPLLTPGNWLIDAISARPRADIFDYIELFYNNRRRHYSNEKPSSIEYESRHQERLSRVQTNGCDS